MRNVFPVKSKEFGTRLKILMEYNHLSCLDLATKLCGYDSKPKSNTYEYEECLCKAKTIRNHLKLGDVTQISTNKSLAVTYLAEYCKIFECSADYFLGYIDYPTKEDADVGNITGLSIRAIDHLRLLYLSEQLSQTGDLDIINFILSDGFIFEFIRGLKLYFSTGYDTVMESKTQPNTNSCIYQPREIPEINNQGKEIFHLGKKMQDGYSCIPISTDILEAHAMQLIQKTLFRWQEIHRKEFKE